MNTVLFSLTLEKNMVKNLDVPKDNERSSSSNKDKKYTVTIPINDVFVEGILRVPHNPRGIVLFAHGSGSGRHSPRNNFVAEILRKARVATLLFDLLTEEEDLIYKRSLKGNFFQGELTRFPYENEQSSSSNRFDIELLTERLIVATKWIKKQPHLNDLKIGYFGASTGAASVLKAAARIGSEIRAVVSRGGRPDLAMDGIAKVKSPTLLIVGENDPQVIELNKQAYDALNTTKKLEIIPGATHLFEEPGTLEKAAELASDWFEKYLSHGFKEGFREYDTKN